LAAAIVIPPRESPLRLARLHIARRSASLTAEPQVNINPLNAILIVGVGLPRSTFKDVDP
jgi:hypothetical protein